MGVLHPLHPPTRRWTHRCSVHGCPGLGRASASACPAEFTPQSGGRRRRLALLTSLPTGLLLAPAPPRGKRGSGDPAGEWASVQLQPAGGRRLGRAFVRAARPLPLLRPDNGTVQRRRWPRYGQIACAGCAGLYPCWWRPAAGGRRGHRAGVLALFHMVIFFCQD